MKWVMIGVWLIGNQPPAPFQVEFNSNANCQKAYGQMLVDFSRKKTAGELVAVCAER